MLVICEQCGRPRPGTRTENGGVRPVGDPECGRCGRDEFRTVGPSDMPAVLVSPDEAVALGDELVRYADELVAYSDDVYLHADEAASVALALAPI